MIVVQLNRNYFISANRYDIPVMSAAAVQLCLQNKRTRNIIRHKNYPSSFCFFN